MDTKELIEQLRKIDVNPLENGDNTGVDLSVRVPMGNVVSFAELLHKESFMLLFVTAVHVDPEPLVVYQMVDTETNLRIRALVSLDEKRKVPSISKIFHGASWYEREIMEFFNIDFDGNEDKRTLILPESDKGLYPLLKEEKKVKSYEDTGFSIE